MNPGLIVKLRPNGPWRIGPDSGARNRVDLIYHSDSLYSAVTSAMARLGWLDEWLDATARTSASAVSFASCFPFMDDLGFVIPPRTAWPPAATSARAERVRWKSARFVPLPVVQSILAGRRPDENQWIVDGPSDCLVPVGRPGPFRIAVRWSAGVDRLSGASERHSMACLEFRPGAGLWTVVSFADEPAQSRWSDPVKAAFRLLADSGFGGERSRGWGRADAPEFTEGTLPDLILPPVDLPAQQARAALRERSEIAPLEPPAQSEEAVPAEALSAEPAPAAGDETTAEASEALTTGETPAPELPAEEVQATEAQTTEVQATEVQATEVQATEAPGTAVPEQSPPVDPVGDPAGGMEEAAGPAAEPHAGQPVSAPVAAEPEPPPAPSDAPAAVSSDVSSAADEAVSADLPPAASPDARPHWLLSVFTPSAADSVDWRRGNYTVLARGGRVESPAGSGGLKKQIQMVAEGSVIYAEAPPRGSAADVAPDGFAHAVFRAGFALAIPLPEVS